MNVILCDYKYKFKNLNYTLDFRQKPALNKKNLKTSVREFRTKGCKYLKYNQLH